MRLVECGVIRTKARDPLATRLLEIHQGISELIARHRPSHLAVEDVFYSRNVRTTLALGHARGVVLLAGETAGISIHEFPPAEVKKAIAGTGSATKEQVQFMLTRLLRLRVAPEPADASDGVAAAVTYMLTAHTAAFAEHRSNGATYRSRSAEHRNGSAEPRNRSAIPSRDTK